MNAKKCREEKIEEKFVRCFIENKGRLKQAEQDILNLCCYPKIKELPIRNLVCTYMYNKGAYDYIKDETILIEIEKAKKFPVQLHYATPIKPWKNLGIPKADEYTYLSVDPESSVAGRNKALAAIKSSILSGCILTKNLVIPLDENWKIFWVYPFCSS